MDELDPLHKVELAMIRAEYQKQYQASINYVKDKVGPGIEYSNVVARVVVSDRGAYYELIDLPEAFSGAASPLVTHHFVTEAEALALLARAVEATARLNADDARHVSILALYSRRGVADQKECYVFTYRSMESGAPETDMIGAFQANQMPLFFKIKIDGEVAREVLGMDRGMVFCLSKTGERCLLIRIPYEGEQIVDLNQLMNSSTIH